MYGSYGSYSSMSCMSAPIDIAPSNMNDQGSCAFPSWPRRSALSHSACEEHATSYLSDDDLFPQDFEDDATSISSSSSVASPVSQSPRVTEVELLEMERQKFAAQRQAQRDYLQFLAAEKERRHKAAKKHRRGSGGSKKSPKSKLSTMTPIVENGE